METKIIWENGSPVYLINGEAYDPVSYRTFWPQERLVRSFGERGFTMFHLFPSGILNSLKEPYSNSGEIWLGEGEYDWERLREHVDMFLRAEPDAKFALLVQLDTREWYLKDHPEAYDSFEQLAVMCRDEQWRASASRFLCDLIDFMEREYPERVYEVHLMAGHTTEWYASYTPEAVENAPQFAKTFAEAFGSAPIPNEDALIHSDYGVLRHPVEDKSAVDFWVFYSEIIAGSIGYFAHVVKTHTNGRLTVGVFYGYLMCFFHSWFRGHNALSRVLEDPNVDVIFCPSAYRPYRGMDSVNAFNLPADSMRLHKKLYLHEIDNTTSLTLGHPQAERVQALHHRPATLDDSITYARRDSARAMAHGAGYWWFDMWCGWFDDARLMAELEQIKAATHAIYAAGADSVAEVAVFTDARSSCYLADNEEYDSVYSTPAEARGGIAVQYDMVYAQQEGLNRLGAPVSYYVARDILHADFPHDRCKLYVFLNLLAPTDEITEKIGQLRAAGKSMLFLYAPGYITPEGFSTDAMRELTGFDFRLAVGEHEGRVVCGDLAWGGDRGIRPLFTVAAANAQVLGRYRESGLPALALRRRGEAIDAWCACGPMPGSVLREIAKAAGVFLWHEGDDPVYINQSMVGLYSCEGGVKTLRVPADCRLTELYGDGQYRTENREVTLTFAPRELRLFLREEL